MADGDGAQVDKILEDLGFKEDGAAIDNKELSPRTEAVEITVKGGDGTEAQVKDSIQARATGQTAGVTISPFFFMARAGELISPWWSKGRDVQLSDFWKRVDHLEGAMYTFQARISTIPFHVEPRDVTVKSHMRQADQFTRMLHEETELGEGWNELIEPTLEDLLGQDNGFFAEVIGDGRPDGPILGPVQSVAHLDSAYATRTGDPEFPVTYNDPISGKISKLHFTRVLFGSQLPSARHRMNGVGVCAVSRAFNNAQGLLDMMVYKQEKLGSRPLRALLLTGGRLAPSHIMAALSESERVMDSKLLRRYSNIVIAGSEEAPDAKAELIEFSKLPDGFNYDTDTMLAMAAIALAFGVDPRELWPGLTTGATRAEAFLQHVKQRGKGYGQTIQMLERKFDFKVLPPQLKMVFDYQDDIQDQQKAEIVEKRSTARERDLNTGTTTVRTTRLKMVTDGEINQSEFEEMELDDGRLSDGTDVLTLFGNPEYSELLNLEGIEDPLDKNVNDPATVEDAITEQRAVLLNALGVTEQIRPRHRIREALAALEALEDYYHADGGETRGRSMPPAPTSSDEETPMLFAPATQESVPGNQDLERIGEKDEMISLKNSVIANYSDETLEIMRQTLEELRHDEPQPIIINLSMPEKEIRDQEDVIGPYLELISQSLKANSERNQPMEVILNVPESVVKQVAPKVEVNVPQQAPPKIEVNVPKQPPPNVNVTAKVDLPVEETIDVEKARDGTIERFKKRRKFRE